jgi:hypothetical protein
MNITMVHGTQPLYKGAEYTMTHVEAAQLIQAGVAVPVSDKSPAAAERAVQTNPAEEKREASTQKKSTKK